MDTNEVTLEVKLTTRNGKTPQEIAESLNRLLSGGVARFGSNTSVKVLSSKLAGKAEGLVNLAGKAEPPIAREVPVKAKVPTSWAEVFNASKLTEAFKGYCPTGIGAAAAKKAGYKFVAFSTDGAHGVYPVDGTFVRGCNVCLTTDLK